MFEHSLEFRADVRVLLKVRVDCGESNDIEARDTDSEWENKYAFT